MSGFAGPRGLRLVGEEGPRGEARKQCQLEQGPNCEPGRGPRIKESPRVFQDREGDAGSRTDR